MKAPRTLVARLALAASVLAPAAAHAGESCDHGADFRDERTLAGLTATVHCVDPDTQRARRDVALRDGVRDGPTTWYHPDTGLPERIERYRNGQRDGVWQRYDRTGRLAEETSYRDDHPTGVFRRYDPQGRVRILGWTTGGRERGARLEYDEQGRLVALHCGDRSWLAEDRSVCGFGTRSTVEFAPDRRGVQRTVQYLNGKLDGVSREIVGGRPVIERVYAAGELREERLRVGEALRAAYRVIAERGVTERYAWFSDGTQKARVRFDDGRVRTVETWWPNGRLRLQATLLDRARAQVRTYDEAGAARDAFVGRLRTLDRTLDATFDPLPDEQHAQFQDVKGVGVSSGAGTRLAATPVPRMAQ